MSNETKGPQPPAEAQAAPPSAPVGVEVWLRPVVTQGEYVAKWGFCNPDEPGATPFYSNALAQQPAAIGEEIMVNAAHDVYTLRLQPSGLSSGPRFVVHVPGPEQPAAVDESFVERFCGRWFQLTGRSLDRPTVRACLTEALAAQPGGSDNDR